MEIVEPIANEVMGKPDSTEKPTVPITDTPKKTTSTEKDATPPTILTATLTSTTLPVVG